MNRMSCISLIIRCSIHTLLICRIVTAAHIRIWLWESLLLRITLLWESLLRVALLLRITLLLRVALLRVARLLRITLLLRSPAAEDNPAAEDSPAAEDNPAAEDSLAAEDNQPAAELHRGSGNRLLPAAELLLAAHRGS